MLIFAILGFDNLGKEILANGVFSAEMNQRHPETTSFISITCCDDLKEHRRDFSDERVMTIGGIVGI